MKIDKKDQTVVTGKDIVAGLALVGVTSGDVVFAHSSLSAFGHVEGSADTVIDALLNAVGVAGTVVMPAFTWGKFRAIDQPAVFDVAHETVKEEVGIIPEVFRLRPDSIRSTHICHSVSAIGPSAPNLMGDGVKCFGKGSTFEHLETLDAWVLFLGASMRTCTAMHHVEDLMQVPYRSYRHFEGSIVVLPDGSREPCRSVEFPPREGSRPDFSTLEQIFDSHDILQTTAVGSAKAINVRIRDIVRVGVQCLEEDVEFLLAE